MILCFQTENNRKPVMILSSGEVKRERSHVMGKKPQLATLLKERLWYKCFPVNFAKFLRTIFSLKHLRWLLLYGV